MATNLDVQISDGPDPSIKLVALEGEFDESNLEATKAKLDPLKENLDIKTMVFNFEGLEFINSKGIGYLVALQTHLAKDKRKTAIVGGSEAVMDVISLVGLTQIIPHFETEEDAISELT